MSRSIKPVCYGSHGNHMFRTKLIRTKVNRLERRQTRQAIKDCREPQPRSAWKIQFHQEVSG